MFTLSKIQIKTVLLIADFFTYILIVWIILPNFIAFSNLSLLISIILILFLFIKDNSNLNISSNLY